MKSLRWMVASCAIALIACGDDAGPNADRWQVLPASSVELTNDNRGLHVTLVGLSTTAPIERLSDQVADSAAFTSTLVVEEQLFSESKHFELVNGNGAIAEPRFPGRIEETYSDARLGDTLAAFEDVVWLVDLQRLDRGWWVDWSGLERDSEELRATEFTLAERAANHDSDFQEAVADYVLEAMRAAATPPGRVVLGTDLEQQYLLAPEDWVNVGPMVQSAADAIRAEFPGTEVSAGLNWNGFMTDVVPTFRVAGEIEEFGAVRRAWEAVIDPLYFVPTFDEDGEEIGVSARLDFYGFSAVPNPEVYVEPRDVPETDFVGISQRFDEAPDRVLPVDWVRVGWPTRDTSAFTARWVSRLPELIGGYEVRLVNWWGFAQYEDTFCTNFILRAGGPRAMCNRGVYSESGAELEVFGAYFGGAE